MAFSSAICTSCALDVFVADADLTHEASDERHSLVTVVLQPDGSWLAERIEIGILVADVHTPPCGANV